MWFRHFEIKGSKRGLPLAAALMFVCIAFVCPVASGATPEAELYQDEKGEWKIKYLNAQPESEAASVPSDEQEEASGTETTEVELYQDEAGEWKVRYITLGEQTPEPEPEQSTPVIDPDLQDETSDEDVLAAEDVLIEESAEEFDAEIEEPTFETTDDEEDDQFKEMTGELTRGSFEDASDILEEDLVVIEDVKPAPKKAAVSAAFQKESPPVYSDYGYESNRDPNRQLEMGVDYTFYNFEQESYQDNLGNTVAKDNEGNLGGIHVGYEHVLPEHGPYHSLVDLIKNIDDVSRYKVTLDYRVGQAEYSDISGSANEDFTQHVLEAKAVAGYDFVLKGNTRLTPFMGFGYRYLNDSSGGVLDIPESGIIYIPDNSLFLSVFSQLRQPYTLESHYFYLPIGLMTHNDILPDLSLGLNLEFDYVFLGIHRSSFNDLGVLYVESSGDSRTMKLRDTTNLLRGGIGLKGSARVTKKNKMLDWFVEPYIRYWHMNESKKEQFPLIISDGQDVILFQSDLVTAYNHIEPENSTTEYGIQIGFVY